MSREEKPATHHPVSMPPKAPHAASRRIAPAVANEFSGDGDSAGAVTSLAHAATEAATSTDNHHPHVRILHE